MLKYKYDNKADIPAAVQSYYTEKDGVFVLQVDGVKTEDDVKSIQDALQKERGLRRDAETKAKTLEDKFGLLPDDFDLDEYNRLKDGDPSKEIDAKLAEQRERITKQFEKTVDGLKKELSEKDGLVNKHVKTATLQRAMAEVGVSKQFMPAVEALMKDRITVEGDKVFLDEQPVSDALKNWANSDEGKHYISAPSNSGGGTDRTTNGDKPTGKTMSRSEFEGLSPADQMKTSKEGVTLTED